MQWAGEAEYLPRYWLGALRGRHVQALETFEGLNRWTFHVRCLSKWQSFQGAGLGQRKRRSLQ